MASFYLLLYRMYFVLRDSSVGTRLSMWGARMASVSQE